MLSEEALIILAAFGACGMLVLGVLELLWPSRPRHVVRRLALVATPLSRRPHRTSALSRHTLEPGRSPYRRRTTTTAVAEPAFESEPPDAVRLDAAPARGAPAHPGALGLPAAPVLDVATREGASPVSMAAGAEAAGAEAAGGQAPVDPAPAEEAAVAASPLREQARYADVIEAAAAALAQATDPAETAALWGVVAMARRAQGENSEARVALEAAISVAPAAERPRYLQQLASLAESVARACLADAERRAAASSEERLGAFRDAMMWLDCAQAAAPGATAAAELASAVDALLWPEWERTVVMLAQRQDYRAARRLLREALADSRFPPSRAETFRSLFSGTFSGELGQLTARAIKSVQDARESDALAALRRAEHLLGALNDTALSVRRREEVDRRLWWGYRALGERRLAAGAYEDALEPLFHAFGYPVGPGPLEETRALLLRALEGVADCRALGIRQLADAGEREAAVVQCDELWALLRDASEMGLSRSDLSGVHGKIQRLFETVNR